MAMGEPINHQTACLAPLLCLCCELVNTNPHVSGRKGNLLHGGQQCGGVTPEAVAVTLRKWGNTSVERMKIFSLFLSLLVSFWLELCLCAQSHIVAMAHKPQTLMSAPVFVYQMELSGRLFALFNHFFPLKCLELFGCGLVLLTCLEHVSVFVEVSSSRQALHKKKTVSITE